MKKGFTLVELLVVITIIGVLLGTLSVRKDLVVDKKMSSVTDDLISQISQIKENASKGVTNQNNDKYKYTNDIYDGLLKLEYEGYLADGVETITSLKDTKDSMIGQTSYYYALILKPGRNYMKYVELEQEGCDTRRESILQRIKNGKVDVKGVDYNNESLSLEFNSLFDFESDNYSIGINKDNEEEINNLRGDLIKKCFVSDRNIKYDDDGRVYLNEIEFNDGETLNSDKSLIIFSYGGNHREIYMVKNERNIEGETKVNSLFLYNYGQYDDILSINQKTWFERNFGHLSSHSDNINFLDNVNLSFSLESGLTNKCGIDDFVELNSLKPEKFALDRNIKERKICITLNDKEINALLNNISDF